MNVDVKNTSEIREIEIKEIQKERQEEIVRLLS